MSYLRKLDNFLFGSGEGMTALIAPLNVANSVIISAAFDARNPSLLQKDWQTAMVVVDLHKTG